MSPDLEPPVILLAVLLPAVLLGLLVVLERVEDRVLRATPARVQTRPDQPAGTEGLPGEPEPAVATA